MKPKILLITLYNHSDEILLEEMGVCFITSYLREMDYDVMLICAREHQIDYRKIIGFRPGIVGVSVYYYTRQAVYNFCTRIQEDLPGIFICAGGYFPSYFGLEMMKEAPFIDFAIRGEGELSFLNLISHLEKGEDLADVKGLIFRRNGEVVVNEDQPLIEDLDILPFQARDILVDNKLKIASISTSRGCARKCQFCNTSNFWNRWRGRDVRYILEEIKHLYQLGIRYFAFNDSSFEDSSPKTGANFERMTAIARGILDLNLDISYIASFRAEFSRSATPELLELLKKSGLRQVRVGIETANERDRKIYGKWASIEDNGNIIEFFQAHNIYVRVGFINFNPYSTFEGLRQNIDFLEKYEWAANFFVLSSRLALYKGTGLYNKAKSDNLMLKKDADLPQYMFVDKRVMNLANYIQSYIYLANNDTNGALSKICNYKNYFQSIVYDFLERFAEGDGQYGRASPLVWNFEQEIKGILSEVNRRNARWFRELLALAQDKWDNRKAFEITSEYLNRNHMLGTVARLEEKRKAFTHQLQSLGTKYQTWISRTWETIENLNF